MFPLLHFFALPIPFIIKVHTLTFNNNSSRFDLAPSPSYIREEFVIYIIFSICRDCSVWFMLTAIFIFLQDNDLLTHQPDTSMFVYCLLFSIHICALLYCFKYMYTYVYTMVKGPPFIVFTIFNMWPPVLYKGKILSLLIS